jgi:predicted HicB family RNase H-like nuclease
MGRLMLRLPDSLHRQLEALASNEAVSLNQYIVNALTRQVTLAYTVQAVPEKTVAEPRAAYTALLQNLGESSFEEIRNTLDERETVPPETGLSTEVVERIKRRVSGVHQ